MNSRAPRYAVLCADGQERHPNMQTDSPLTDNTLRLLDRHPCGPHTNPASGDIPHPPISPDPAQRRTSKQGANDD